MTKESKGFAPTDRLILIIDTWMPSIADRESVSQTISGKYFSTSVMWASVTLTYRPSSGQSPHCMAHENHSERQSCVDAAGNALFPQNQGTGRAFLSQRESKTDGLGLELLDLARAREYEAKLERKLLALMPTNGEHDDCGIQQET